MATSIPVRLVTLLLAASPSLLVAAENPQLPNIVVLLADDLGYADLGCTGAADLETPHIDRLAKEGVRFTDFYANAPVCTPTRAAFLTGRYQRRCGLEWAFGFTAEQHRRVKDQWVPEPDKLAFGLSAETPTLAKWLKNAGYATAMYGKWHLGYQPEFNPIRHGFDDYFGVLLGHVDYYRYTNFEGTNGLRKKDQPTTAKGYFTDIITDRAVEFIGKSKKQPFFLYVPYTAVHWPFQPPDRPEPPLTKDNKYDGTRQDYVRMVESLDQSVGRILKALDKHDLARNTLVVFTSDNGGERLSNNRPLFNHKATLWEGGIRVPAILRWPATLPSGKVTEQPAITMDLTATILAAVKAKLPKDTPFDGIDLTPLLLGDNPLQERTLCWRMHRNERQMKAIRHGNWKLVQDGTWIEMLFDLSKDKSERTDLAYEQPRVLQDLRKRLAAWEADVDRVPPPVRVR